VCAGCAVVASFLPFLVACDSRPRDVVQDTTSAPADHDPCSTLEGATFRSIDQREIGLGPDGPILWHWFVSFRGNQFDWSWSDVQQNGSFTCTQGEIRGWHGEQVLHGRIDSESGTLTWEDLDYRRVD
jgi:hypothetical protein